jgi:HisJ family histidinol phosphate phosphatase
MNKKLRVDLHNHTTLCNHATGSVEEYVKRAIELGIDEYGFACHAPMNFDPKYRMKLEERTLYEKWVNEAKEKYKDKIKNLEIEKNNLKKTIKTGYRNEYINRRINEITSFNSIFNIGN